MTVVLDVDAYGADARRSAIADFVELAAFRRPISRNELSDYVRDCGLAVPPPRLVTLGDDVGEASMADDDPPIVSQRVFDLLAERSRRLGTLYPFSLESTVLTRTAPDVMTTYDATLAMTIRHAYFEDSTIPELFEDFVCRSLRASSMTVFPLSYRVRATDGFGVERFGGVLDEARGALNLAPATGGLVSRAVHDGSVDVLARHPPTDSRPGFWTLLCQVTVGKTTLWETKLKNRKLRSWSHYLGDPLPPLFCVAVPHHVEPWHLESLVIDSEGATVLDRLRLVASGVIASESEQALARSLIEGGAEF